MLINNAGIMACPETRVGPGWEAQFATNHLGHYALVNRLWPRPRRRAAPAWSSSRPASAASPTIRWDDVHFTSGYDKWQAYGQAKAANALFADAAWTSSAARPAYAPSRSIPGTSSRRCTAPDGGGDGRRRLDRPARDAACRSSIARAGGGDAGVGRDVAAARRRPAATMRGVQARGRFDRPEERAAAARLGRSRRS